MSKILKNEYFPATLVFLITTLIFFWGNIVGDSFFWEDVVEYVYPVQSFAASSNGIPFWNPYTFGGMPFFADLQAGVLYPLNRLLDLFVADNKLPFAALQLVIILHFFISQINTYYLSRKINISKGGSLIVAISYSFSLLMVCHVIHPMMIYHLTWLPLVLAFLFKGAQSNKLYYSFLAGGILGLSFLSGHPQTLLYEIILIGIIFLTYLILNLKNESLNKLKLVLSVLITFALAYGIFTVQYFPSQELADLSQRSEINYEKASEGSLYIKQVFTSVVPNLFGEVSGENIRRPSFYLTFGNSGGIHFYWETAFYFGIITLSLALFALMTGWKKQYNFIFLIVSLFGLFFSFGSNFFFFDIIYNLPLVGNFRNPGRMMFFMILGFSILAGIGFDRILQSKKEDFIKLAIAFGIPFLIALLASTGVFFDFYDTPANVHEITSTAGRNIFLLLISFVVVFVAYKKKLNPKLTGYILALVIFIDLFSVGNSFNKNPQNPVDTSTPQGYDLPEQFKSTFKPDLPNDIFRVNMRMYEPVRYMSMKRNQGMIDRIMLIEGYNPLILERVNPPTNTKEENLNLKNVRYSIGIDRKINAPRFYENKNAIGNAWFVNNSKVFESDEEVEKFMKSEDYNPREIVVLEDSNYQMKNNDSSNVKIQCISYNNNNLEYEISTSTDGFLCLSEIYYPNWKAKVNGKDKDLLRANYCFRAIPVEKGKNKVQLYYESSGFNTGLVLFIISIAISSIGFVLLKKYEI